MTASTIANPRVAIGNNSRAAELAALAQIIREEMNVSAMAPIWRARWEIILSDMETHDKLVALVTSFFADKEGHNAHPGVKKLELLTSMSERRVRLGLKINEDRGFLVKQGGGHRGRASLYTVQVPEKTLIELSERWNDGAANATYAANERRHGETAYEEKGGTETPERRHGGATQLIEPINKKITPLPPVREASGRTWAKRDPFALNPWQAKHHDDVKFDEEFRLEVHNGFESEILKTIAPVKLDLREVLDEAARWVPHGAAPTELKIAVRGQVALQVSRAKERRQVAEQRAAQRPVSARGMPPGAAPPDEPDWVREKRERRENLERLNAAKAKVSNGKWGQS